MLLRSMPPPVIALLLPVAQLAAPSNRRVHPATYSSTYPELYPAAHAAQNVDAWKLTHSLSERAAGIPASAAKLAARPGEELVQNPIL